MNKMRLSHAQARARIRSFERLATTNPDFNLDAWNAAHPDDEPIRRRPLAEIDAETAAETRMLDATQRAPGRPRKYDIGTTFGQLTITARNGNRVLLDCTCGTKGVEVTIGALTHGGKEDCGCVARGAREREIEFWNSRLRRS